MKATLIQSNLPGFKGVANLYQLDPPLDGHVYVIVSAANVMFGGPETYIFGATPDGSVSNWCELEGSFEGGLDHGEALCRAGYVVVPEGA